MVFGTANKCSIGLCRVMPDTSQYEQNIQEAIDCLCQWPSIGLLKYSTRQMQRVFIWVQARWNPTNTQHSYILRRLTRKPYLKTSHIRKHNLRKNISGFIWTTALALNITPISKQKVNTLTRIMNKTFHNLDQNICWQLVGKLAAQWPPHKTTGIADVLENIEAKRYTLKHERTGIPRVF